MCSGIGNTFARYQKDTSQKVAEVIYNLENRKNKEKEGKKHQTTVQTE